ncbi:MAG: arylsulfatase [Bacteroidetes bacterium]|nr:arylsulfatase [Bacteroidota bacterium]
MNAPLRLTVVIILLVSACTTKDHQTNTSANNSGGLDRTVLPIQEPVYAHDTTLDARNAKAPSRFEVKAPTGAPNVLVILIDDIGFGASNAFGGPCQMPNLDRLAAGGLRYNRFHTTSLCSPTRMALLTGRNHHLNNAGAIMELATAFPGNTGIRPNRVTPLAEMMRLNGYNTAAFGKYHETPPWEVSASGPFDRWPTHSGFEKFYGFIGGETNQWAPAVYDGTIRVEPEMKPDYHFTTDMTDQALNWLQAQQSLTPDKPFFMYFATGATHAPHHAPKAYIDKYKGKFDQGWDKLREEIFARQKELGVIPKDTKLTARPAEIEAWDNLTAEQKKLFSRQMETFAGFAEHTDHEVGRLIDAMQGMNILDNTLVFYIVGDNGASAEGGPEGNYNEMMALNGIIGKSSQMMPHYEEWGGPNTFPHFAVGWAHAMNTPFQWAKQVASHFGGTRNGMVVHWPNRVKSKGELRSQFSHVTDIAPTILEATKLPFPKTVNGTEQIPFSGTSLVYSFDNSSAPETHTTQYFEMFGNRAIYHDGWVAAARHSIPWLVVPLPPLKDDVWELYNVREDFSESNNLAASNPEKLKELKAKFDEVAKENYVFPIDDRRSERLNAAIAGRPDLLGERKSLSLYEGMTGIMENVFINIKTHSYTITAEVDVPAKANGVIISQAGKFGGWSLYTLNGKPCHEYNFFGLERTKIAGPSLSAGKHTIKYEFNIDELKPASGGVCLLYVDGKQVANGRIPKTEPFSFSGDEGVDVGMDRETNVSNDYPQMHNHFNGKIAKVVVEVTK